MNIYFILWCLFFLVAIIFELFSPGFFFFLSFAIGSIAAACTNYLEMNMTVQLIAFSVVSFISLFLLRRFVSQTLRKAPPATNADALIGKKGIVLTDIKPNEGGYSKINGEIWLSKSTINEVISVGQMIEVLGVKGSHVIVKKLDY